MTKHKMVLRLKRKHYGVHEETLLSFEKNKLNYLRFYLNKVKNRNTMVMAHEQGDLTRFLRLDSLELILGQVSLILELWIINCELITNYQGLLIKSVITK
jgi:hypothetical protein